MGESDADHQLDRRQVLRAGVGAATAAVGVAALGGQTAAHFEEDLDVEVKPGADRNLIVTGKPGLVPVAVYGTEEFDPTEEAVRYRFGAPETVESDGGARPLGDGWVADLDDDGSEDLLLFFSTRETGLESDVEEARLVWEESEEGAHGLAGTADVTVVGRRRGRWWR